MKVDQQYNLNFYYTLVGEDHIRILIPLCFCLKRSTWKIRDYIEFVEDKKNFYNT